MIFSCNSSAFSKITYLLPDSILITVSGLHSTSSSRWGLIQYFCPLSFVTSIKLNIPIYTKLKSKITVSRSLIPAASGLRSGLFYCWPENLSGSLSYL